MADDPPAVTALRRARVLRVPAGSAPGARLDGDDPPAVAALRRARVLRVASGFAPGARLDGHDHRPWPRSGAARVSRPRWLRTRRPPRWATTRRPGRAPAGAGAVGGEHAAHQRLEVLERQRVVGGVERGLVPLVGEALGERRTTRGRGTARGRSGRRRSARSSAGPGSPGARESSSTPRRARRAAGSPPRSRGWFGTLTALPMSWSSAADDQLVVGPGALGERRRLQRVRELVDREAVGDRRRGSAAWRGPTRRPGPGGRRSRVTITAPLLGGRLVHPGEGLGHARHCRSRDARDPSAGRAPVLTGRAGRPGGGRAPRAGRPGCCAPRRPRSRRRHPVVGVAPRRRRRPRRPATSPPAPT